jgi:Asp-tRNA(Asn)/Glu-tRNA(Gln) amidotransferase A subunit family amidase
LGRNGRRAARWRERLQFSRPSSSASTPFGNSHDIRALDGPAVHSYPRMASMTAIHDLSLAEIAERVRTKVISPREVVESHLSRAAELHPRLNAFVHIDEAGARAQAEAAETVALNGGSLGPLHGVPISVKSCIDVVGWPCAAGSLLRKDNQPNSDAVLVQRLRKAGAILLGNTNTPEFLMAYETDNRLSGKTSNPWNTEYSSGGSSGGEAAAIASGCSAGGVGSDGGGSIRVPAHFCGICGLKPTPGQIPSSGHYPAGNSAFGWLGVVGPMARTVGDLRILFEVLRGPDSGDALSAPFHGVDGLRAPSRGEMRVGVLEGDALGSVTPETQLAVRQAAQLLAYQGFKLEPFRLSNLERVLELWWFFFGSVVGELFAGEIRGRQELLSSIFSDYLEAARESSPAPPMTMERFVGMCAARDCERAHILEAMCDVPILLSPVCAAPAFRHGEGNWKAGTGYRDTMRHSQWLNLAGLPGVTVPIGKSAEGLPVGVQLIGRSYEDWLVLSVAEQLEAARGPWSPPPL